MKTILPNSTHGSYFYMDHARKACITALPNLVTESHLECRFTKNLCRAGESVFLSRFWKESLRKTYNLRCSLRSLNCSCQKIGLPPVSKTVATGVQKTAVLKHSVSQESQIPVFVLLETFLDRFLGSSTRSLPFSHIFLHNSLKYLSLVCLAALQYSYCSITIWMFGSPSSASWCITGL